MVLRSLLSAVSSFISRKLSEIGSFTGKNQITIIKTNNNSIRNDISRALRSTEFYRQAIASELHSTHPKTLQYIMIHAKYTNPR